MRAPVLLLSILAALGWVSSFAKGAPVLSEVMADNEAVLADEDGEFRDWIEIYNPAAATVDLGGWHLSDDAEQLQRWTFPAGAGVSVPPGSYLVVFASGKDRGVAGEELHTNFKLDADGEQLFLSAPDGVPSSTLNYPTLPEDVSFGMAYAEGVSLVTPELPATFFIPTNDVLGDTWTEFGFNDTGWTSGTASIGFDDGTSDGSSPGLLGYWSFDDARNPSLAPDGSANGHDGTVTGATYTADGSGRSGEPGDRALDFGTASNGANVRIADAALGAFDEAVSEDALTISLWTFGGAELPENNSAFWASETPTGGIRTAQAHLPWSNGSIFWDTAGCCDPSETRITKTEPDPANYKGRWNHYVFVKEGPRKEIWQNGALFHSGTNSFPLTAIRGFWIGSAANGGNSFPGLIDDFAIWGRALGPQEIVSLAAGNSPLALLSFVDEFGTDLQAAMSGVSASAFVRVPFQLASMDGIDRLTLRLRYNDGVVLSLNGVEVARRNAPADLAVPAARASASRAKLEGFADELIDISGHRALLREGANVIVAHGLNDDPAGSDFLLTVALEGAGEIPDRFFTVPTPGAPNGLGVAGFVAEPRFAPGRGFYPAPVAVTIACATPGATLIYTIDGTEPAEGNGTRIEALGPFSRPSATVMVSSSTPLRATAIHPDLEPARVASHTYLFIDEVANQGPNPPGYPATWGVYGSHGPFVGDPFPADYGMDPEVVNSTEPGYGIRDALLSLPAVCISVPPEDLFDAARGIWSNSVNHGDDWERAASVEFLFPDGSPDFQENGGLRAHGGLSRQHFHAHKHSLRMHFRRKYGASRLRFRLFPDSPVDNFDEIVLRASSTDSWSVQDSGLYAKDKATYLRDVWVKDTQLAMGRPGGHSRYVHVFLNGLYFGQYNMAERNVQAWNAIYLGGEKGDYDILKDANELQSGSREAWEAMMALAAAGLESEAAYQQIQGNNPDGTRNPAFPVYLDVGNLIDYMILHLFIGAIDWPVHNWWASRRRGPESEGFRFFAWDQELSILSLTRTETFGDGPFETVSKAGTPAFLYDRLRPNPSFRTRFAVRVQELLFDGGVLAPERNKTRWRHRQDEIDRSIVAESARWGDSRRTTPYRREIEWLAEMAWMADTFWHQNHALALKRFENAGLFPATRSDAPNFSHSGGRIDPRFPLSIIGSAGMVYVTTDGSDPRTPQGAISPTARAYAVPIRLSRSITILARSLDGADWSGLREASYYPGTAATAATIAITEIHYQPPEGDAEFIELTNLAEGEVDLSGLSFAAGIEYIVPQGTRLPPGGRLTIRGDEFSGRLDNAGERIILLAEDRAVISDFVYSDDAPWPSGAGGGGFSLTLREPVGAMDPNLPTSWRRSVNPGGSPGGSDAVLFAGPDPEADLDGDGWGAFVEHALGTSDAIPNPNILTVRQVGGVILVSYPRQLAADDAVIVPEVSSDLRSWQATELTVLSADRGMVTARLSPAGEDATVQFVRLRIRTR